MSLQADAFGSPASLGSGSARLLPHSLGRRAVGREAGRSDPGPCPALDIGIDIDLHIDVDVNIDIDISIDIDVDIEINIDIGKNTDIHGYIGTYRFLSCLRAQLILAKSLHGPPKRCNRIAQNL